ncbi:hypothetical protein C0992_003754, partial [Termitomyces sp. T32_za158]
YGAHPPSISDSSAPRSQPPSPSTSSRSCQSYTAYSTRLVPHGARSAGGCSRGSVSSYVWVSQARDRQHQSGGPGNSLGSQRACWGLWRLRHSRCCSRPIGQRTKRLLRWRSQRLSGACDSSLCVVWHGRLRTTL